MNAKRKQQIRAAAEKLLKLAEVTTAPVPVEHIATLIGADLRYVPYDGDMSGLVFREDGRAIIGINAVQAKTRQRFTIAHEIGHLQLHDEQEFHIDRHYRMSRSDQASPDPKEVDANMFAAELLMPADFVRRDLGDHPLDVEDDGEILERLAKQYKVSLQAMIIRLTSLGLINQPQVSPY